MNIKTKKQKGFSLLELMISMFIFSSVILSASFVFGKTMKAYRNTSNIQKNLENTQFALSLMAKVIRNGQINDLGSNKIEVYNSIVNGCDAYEFFGNELRTGSSVGACVGATVTSEILANNISFADSSFMVIPNADDQFGFVTIIMRLCSDASCSNPDKMTLQTSISLRNHY